MLYYIVHCIVVPHYAPFSSNPRLSRRDCVRNNRFTRSGLCRRRWNATFNIIRSSIVYYIMPHRHFVGDFSICMRSLENRRRSCEPLRTLLTTRRSSFQQQSSSSVRRKGGSLFTTVRTGLIFVRAIITVVKIQNYNRVSPTQYYDVPRAIRH